MKYFIHPLSALVLGLTLSVPAVHASLNSAEITRLHNDVRVRYANSSERPAKIGDQISGQTLVRTGMKSRTELKFNDDTLTRLGANTVFSFERGSRNMEVGSGTLFLQVPKDAGGARINTAAVTAAVTGTTIMIEVDANNVVKIIVLEGSLELNLTGDSRVKQTLTAGQMIVMEPNAQTIPQPVNVDLELLIKTSKLINEEEFDKLPDEAKSKIADAVTQQQEQLENGDLSKTNLIIPGAGSSVILTDVNFERRLQQYLDALGGGTPPPPGEEPPPTGNNQFAQLTRPILQPGLWNINDGTSIRTNPTIVDGSKVGQGTIYVPSLAGSFTQWAFGTPDTASGGAFQNGLNRKNAWSVFLLEDILVSGTPMVNADGPRQVIFTSPNAINFEDPTFLDNGGPSIFEGSLFQVRQMASGLLLDNMALSGVGFATQDAPINVKRLDVLGKQTDFALFANGPGGDINIDSYFQLGNGSFIAFAGRDINTNFGSYISADVVDMRARGRVKVEGTTVNANDLFINSGGAVRVTNSSQLSLMTSAAGAGGFMEIRSRNGNVVLDGASTMRADGPMQTLEIITPNGDILVGDPSNLETTTTLSASSLVAFRASGQNQPMIWLRNTAVSSGNRIDVLARGPGANVEIGGFSTFNAPNIRVFAEGSGSVIHFTGFTEMNANQVRLGARRIQVATGANVNVNAPNIGIFADDHYYDLNGMDENGYGRINTGNTIPTRGSYDQR